MCKQYGAGMRGGVAFGGTGDLEGGHILYLLIWALYVVLEQRDLSPLTCWRLNAPKCPSKYHSEIRGGWLRKTGCGYLACEM
jgi:hypothetical protein